MSINSRIVGVGSSKPAELLRKGRGTGQIVYTEEIRDTVANGLPLLNPIFGLALNQNGAFGGTPVQVHNGTDTVLWTGSNISGNKVTFDSTEQKFTGTKSVKVDNPNSLNTWQFAKGSSQALTGYTAITFKIYVDSNWGSGDSVTIFGWDTGTSTIVGVAVPIDDYFNESQFGEWQTVAIPLLDLGLENETIDAIRMQQALKSGAAATFFIDVLQIEQTGGGIEFKGTPNAGTTFEVKSIVYQWVGTGTGGAAFSYNKIGHIAKLTNGIVVRAQIEDEAVFTSTFTQLSDFTFSGANIMSVVDDGTNTMVTLNLLNQFGQGQVLKSGSNDFISATINDDLSGLDEFRILLQGNEENILI